MPHNDPDQSDPMTLHGVSVGTDDPTVTREMAVCFIEEYLRMGYGRERVLSMFANPGYAGPYMAGQALGEPLIATLVDEIAARWGGRRDDTADAPQSDLKILSGSGR